MSETKWTPAQRNCIDARGGTVLVSAAAGSGKTAVLIERILSLLCDADHPVGVDELLVVTFTKAAAAEMRARLNNRLAEKIAADPHNRHLLRQQMLLPQASICTIDSFCANLLREQAQTVGISPQFHVAEDTALKLLKQETAASVIEEGYQSADPDFIKLCNTISGDRSDKKLSEQLLRTYEFIQAHPFPDKWLDKQQAHFEAEGAFTDSVWGKILLEQAKEDLEAARNAMATALREIADDEAMQKAYAPSFAISLTTIERALAALDGSWNDAVDAVRNIQFNRLGSLRGYDDEVFKAHITGLREYAKSLIENHISKALADSEEKAIQDVETAAPLVRMLFWAVRRFTERFSAAKAEQNMLDFNDMEHLALSLLATPNEDGSFSRTDAAKEIGARFRYIMVDEYQDTNATQDTLFSALSDNETNLFFVGDIKQSIYGFRQAMPSIFQHRRENSTAYDGATFPASITLGNNFRSRPQVADSVNFFFRKWMRRQTGGIVYDENEELVASATFPSVESSDYDTELLVMQKKESQVEFPSHQAEARVVGKRILELMEEGFCVTDKSGLRKATYRDMCILLRSTSRTAPIYVRELQKMGIPVSSGAHESFFDCAEIRMILSFLRTVDNPLNDIPMIATLMSPIFGFTPDDVSEIRLFAKHLPFFSAIRRLSRKNNRLANQCRSFLDVLDRYRMLSAAMPADHLIRRIYEETDLLSIMSAKSGGAARIANLRRFYDLARRFEQQDFRGLSAFIRHMDKLESRGIDIAVSSGEGDSQNTVKLMTIHRSKGLEFPIVFVAGLGSDFNNASVKDDILLHAEYGIGMTLRDRKTLTESHPLHRQAIATAITRSERTEELRVLYVAMTRAKDKLILVTAVNSLQSTLERLRTAVGERSDLLPASFILHASRMSDWILAAALSHPAGGVLHDVLFGDALRDNHTDGLWIRPITPPPEEDIHAEEVVSEDTVTLEDVTEKWQYLYPYAPLSKVTAKITASQIAHQQTDKHTTPYLPLPSFLSKGGLAPTKRGTAAHIFLEHFAIGAPLCAEEQANRLVDCGILSEIQLSALPFAQLDRFLQSDTAKRMAASPLVLREFPFTVERYVTDFDASLADLVPRAEDETVIVQGIVDVVFEEDDGLVIVDHKTDRIKEPSQLIERYRSQLEVYKEALSRILQRPIKACMMYSFHLGKEIYL